MKRKKLLTLLLIFAMSHSVIACGSEEDTSNNIAEQKENEIEMVEETLENVTFNVPAYWTKEDVTKDPDSTIQYLYQPDTTTKDYMISLLLIKADNEIYTKEVAESYMDLFMTSFFSEQSGYKGEFTSYDDINVPARKGNYTSTDGSTTAEVYCYMTNVDSILVLFNCYKTEEENLYSEEFELLIDSLEITNFDGEFKNDDSTSGASSSDSFTNKYGTKDTECAVSGCANKIATSGDTNCCISHSNTCLECGCYIDGDAMYCMDCLGGAVEESSNSSSSNTGCGYKYPDGSICGASINNYDSLCDYHFSQLNETYNSLVN